MMTESTEPTQLALTAENLDKYCASLSDRKFVARPSSTPRRSTVKKANKLERKPGHKMELWEKVLYDRHNIDQKGDFVVDADMVRWARLREREALKIQQAKKKAIERRKNRTFSHRQRDMQDEERRLLHLDIGRTPDVRLCPMRCMDEIVCDNIEGLLMGIITGYTDVFVPTVIGEKYGYQMVKLFGLPDDVYAIKIEDARSDRREIPTQDEIAFFQKIREVMVSLERTYDFKGSDEVHRVSYQIPQEEPQHPPDTSKFVRPVFSDDMLKHWRK